MKQKLAKKEKKEGSAERKKMYKKERIYRGSPHSVETNIYIYREREIVISL